MVQTLQARTLTLRDLIASFGLHLTLDPAFFREWQVALPEVTETEKAYLDRVKAGYLNLIEYPPLLEKAVQMAILSPILFLAEFYLPPFHIKTEKSIEISAEDEGVVVRGQLDILLLRDQFWVMVIESKEASFSPEAGLAQLLTYMLANPQPERPGFSLIASGGSFTFVKLQHGRSPQYGLSQIFEIRNPGNELYEVFAILKGLGQPSTQ